MRGWRDDLVNGAGTLEDARAWLREADRILLSAGAGLSAAAGYDYEDPVRFAELFPGLHRSGFTARYQIIGARIPPEYLWGFWAIHTTDVRFDSRPNTLYQKLRGLVGHTDHFVLTSNVDALFVRGGFDPSRVYTPQGDYGLYQCEKPCSREVWDSRPVIERALGELSPTTGATSPEAVPRCPRCGGATYLNVNVGRNFIRDHFVPQGLALEGWLNEDVDARLVVLEIGAGFSTPGVVRWPDEHITRQLNGARLVRVNPAVAGVPADLAERSASLVLPAVEVTGELLRG